MPKEPSSELRVAWIDVIQKNGVKRLKVRTLLKAFGAEKRGPAILKRVNAWCQVYGLYPNGLDRANGLDSVVSLSDIEIRRLGDLVQEEKELTARFERDIAPALGGLVVVQRSYCPHGSRDVFDFLCRDSWGRSVVVELKKADGERRAVEQVLRYIRSLRRDPAHASRDPRGIIVTGEGDLATRRALEELEPGYHIDWYVYGIVGEAIVLERQRVDGTR